MRKGAVAKSINTGRQITGAGLVFDVHAIHGKPMRKHDRILHGRGERGFYLVTLTLALGFLLGAVGLAIDIGRMYIVKSEVQSFVDSAALYGAAQLDGASNGLALAKTAISR